MRDLPQLSLLTDGSDHSWFARGVWGDGSRHPRLPPASGFPAVAVEIDPAVGLEADSFLAQPGTLPGRAETETRADTTAGVDHTLPRDVLGRGGHRIAYPAGADPPVGERG